jgi:predicted nucleotidyltransferase component of viral defense system
MKLESNAYNALLPKTTKTLQTLAMLPLLSSFTFVGGSALAMYLQHRQSEDLDFFTWKKNIDKVEIQTNIQENFTNFQLVNDSELQQDWIIEGVKVTFFANNWDALSERQLFDNQLFVANFELLAAMKVNTLFLRAKYRDYYDLYAIVKSGVSVSSLFEIALRYLPSINIKLFQMALIYTDDIDEENINYLSPIYKISKKKIGTFFQHQL